MWLVFHLELLYLWFGFGSGLKIYKKEVKSNMGYLTRVLVAILLSFVIAVFTGLNLKYMEIISEELIVVGSMIIGTITLLGLVILWKYGF